MKLHELKVGDKFSIISSLTYTTFVSGMDKTILVNEYEKQREKSVSRRPGRMIQSIVSESENERIEEAEKDSIPKYLPWYVLKAETQGQKKAVFTVDKVHENRVRAKMNGKQVHSVKTKK